MEALDGNNFPAAPDIHPQVQNGKFRPKDSLSHVNYSIEALIEEYLLNAASLHSLLTNWGTTRSLRSVIVQYQRHARRRSHDFRRSLEQYGRVRCASRETLLRRLRTAELYD